MAEKTRLIGVQDTGNPVLDSTINYIASRTNFPAGSETLESVHAAILKLALQEPDGLKSYGKPVGRNQLPQDRPTARERAQELAKAK